MKKRLLFLTLLFTLMYSMTCLCATNDGTWINWDTHDMYTPPSDVWARQQYKYYMIHDNHPGVTIFYRNGTQSKLWYLSYYNTATIREQYTDGSGTTYTNMSALTSAYQIIDANFWSNFTLESGKTLYGFSVTVDASSLLANNSDLTCTSTNDLKSQLIDMGWTNPIYTDTGDLPFLSYSYKSNYMPVVKPGFIHNKITLLWNYAEKEPYASNVGNYTFDIIAYANFDNNVPEAVDWDDSNMTINPENMIYVTQGGYNLSVNEYSFDATEVGKAVFDKSGKSFDYYRSGYYLGIRTISNDRESKSYYKIFKVANGCMITSTGDVVKNDGSIIDDSPAENANDNLSPTNNSNPNGVSQYTNDNNTSAQSDPSSGMYNGEASFNVGTVMNELKSIVNTLGELPNVMWQVLSFLPSWFAAMFAISLTLIIAIGTVKIILGK